jgi:uncharacterized protein YndB with AHSA1/START domain
MKNAGSLKVETSGDREIVMTREFRAPRKLVFDALIKPGLIQRWLLGPPGWSMPVCEYDPKVGGAYRFVWQNDSDGSRMGLGGVVREIIPGEKLVATEKFDEPWYPGEAVVTHSLAEKDGRTTLTMTILYQSREARDTALQSPMEQGVAASYDRLEQFLASIENR